MSLFSLIWKTLREFSPALPRVTGITGVPLLSEAFRHFLAVGRPAPDGNGLVALQHHVAPKRPEDRERRRSLDQVCPQLCSS